ncbi:ligand-binding sensor domain-containing diguanylate cyclase [Colwellia psychrerythraea]|uniref:diguanylate cyclase n=1 Tax=Colwellia psychrerythraea TaxID=28229 RepID=A0A099KGR9_COLPS|nr:ligand-binding sensor domain-containing diguanylate cyclase [Colwellia psychrerythraea]KGJ89177.1 diguanylate cyclase with beta propeller sensor [Colwellia psychrerythraea]
MLLFQRLLLTFTFSLLISAFFTKASEYKADLLTEEDGFTSFEVYSIVQDRQGFLWFGTSEHGLMRYDGNKVTHIEYDMSNPSGLSHTSAGNLSLGQSNSLWIGTWGGGANRYQLDTGVFEHFQHNPNKSTSISSNRIQSFYQDINDIMWIGTYADGFNQYQSQSNNFKRFKHDPKKNSLSNNRVWGITAASDDELWIATSYGINLFDKKTQVFTHFLPDTNSQSATGKNEVRHVLKTKQGQLYIGTAAGVLSFNKSYQEFTLLESHQNTPIGKVYSLIEDRFGVVWVGTDTGLYQFEQQEQIIEAVPLPKKGGVRIVFEDNSGAIWVTSPLHGIYKIYKKRKFMAVNDVRLKSPNSVLTDENGDLIIVTAASEILKWNTSTQKLETVINKVFSSSIDSISMSRSADIPIIAKDSDDILWVAQQSRLIQLNMRTGVISNVEYQKSHPDHDLFGEFRALAKAPNEQMWIGTYKAGIHVYDNASNSFIANRQDLHSLSHPEVNVIYRDRNDRMWVGTGKGLNLWHEKTKEFEHFLDDNQTSGRILGNIILAIFQSEDGTIWVGTEKGLNKFNETTGTFHTITSKDGLASNLIRAINEADNGYLWVTTSKGISSVDTITSIIKNYDPHDGLLGVQYYPNSLSKTNDDSFYFSGPRGINFFNPKKIKDNEYRPNVVLTGFSKMGKEVTLAVPFSYVKNIQLSYLDNAFSFEFAALDYNAPERNKYAYRLLGFNNDWLDINQRNSAFYTNLAGGDYIFQVKATNSDGVWSDKFLTINLTISTAPWRAWWALLSYVILVVLLIMYFIRLHTLKQQRVIKQQQQFVKALEQQVAEKTSSLSKQTLQLRIANKELEALSFKDGLTGLFNRRYFDSTLSKEINRHRRHNKPLSLLMCDVDYFKLYNDHYGHVEGDKCLKLVAQSIKEITAREGDSGCRYGGEEFALILAQTNSSQAELIAKHIQTALEKLSILHETSLSGGYISMSYGVFSSVPTKNCSPEMFISKADEALYKSKDNGRNKITILCLTT